MHWDLVLFNSIAIQCSTWYVDDLLRSFFFTLQLQKAKKQLNKCSKLVLKQAQIMEEARNTIQRWVVFHKKKYVMILFYQSHCRSIKENNVIFSFFIWLIFMKFLIIKENKGEQNVKSVCIFFFNYLKW